jgi:hypothetical protein
MRLISAIHSKPPFAGGSLEPPESRQPLCPVIFDFWIKIDPKASFERPIGPNACSMTSVNRYVGLETAH